ncbi:MAG TPA: FKBP-type peptidyl-prolyl cis-trans isomerase [Acidimicrobiales bacterium]
MATTKRERQKAGHRARLDAERVLWARYRRRRRLTMVALIAAGVVAAAVLVVALSRGGDSTTATATTTTASTSTTAPLESAAGKPCVALSEALPAGAPDVPVPVGAPPTELVSEDLVVGSGTPAAIGDDITVNYIGVSCSTGTIFDSSYSRNQPATFPLAEGSLIQGWTDGLPGMQPGGQRLLVIPPDLGYGASAQGSIAPDETLVFVVELVSAGPATTTTTAAP